MIGADLAQRLRPAAEAVAGEQDGALALLETRGEVVQIDAVRTLDVARIAR